MWSLGGAHARIFRRRRSPVARVSAQEPPLRDGRWPHRAAPVPSASQALSRHEAFRVRASWPSGKPSGRGVEALTFDSTLPTPRLSPAAAPGMR